MKKVPSIERVCTPSPFFRKSAVCVNLLFDFLVVNKENLMIKGLTFL